MVIFLRGFETKSSQWAKLEASFLFICFVYKEKQTEVRIYIDSYACVNGLAFGRGPERKRTGRSKTRKSGVESCGII